MSNENLRPVRVLAPITISTISVRDASKQTSYLPFNFQAMDKVRNRCVEAISCVFDPYISVVTKIHPSRTNTLALTFEKAWQLVAEPASLLDAFTAMICIGKRVSRRGHLSHAKPRYWSGVILI